MAPRTGTKWERGIGLLICYFLSGNQKAPWQHWRPTWIPFRAPRNCTHANRHVIRPKHPNAPPRGAALARGQEARHRGAPKDFRIRSRAPDPGSGRSRLPQRGIWSDVSDGLRCSRVKPAGLAEARGPLSGPPLSGSKWSPPADRGHRGDTFFRPSTLHSGTRANMGKWQAIERRVVWLRCLRTHLREQAYAGRQSLLCGDFNVIPDGPPKRGSAYSEREQRESARLCELGFVDLYRRAHPSEKAGLNFGFRSSEEASAVDHQTVIATGLKAGLVPDFKTSLESLLESRGIPRVRGLSSKAW